MHCATDGTESQSLQLIYGVAITLVGAALTLASFGLTDTSAVLRFWPAALVVAGGVGVARAIDGPGRVWSWFWVLAPGWIPIVLALGFMVAAAVIVLIAALLE